MFLRLADITMHVQQRGRPGRASVVFLHSIGTNLHLWDDVAETLSETWRTTQIDMRGHGLTSTAPGSTTVEALAADVEQAIASLGLHAVHLVGISLGGAVALRVGSNAPSHLKSIVLCDTDMAFTPPEFWKARADAARNGGLEAFVEASIGRWVSAAARNSASADGLRAMLRRTDPQGYAAAAEALMACDLAPRAALIGVPTLVLVGEADQSTPVARARDLQRAIGGARLRVLPGLAHLPPAEAPSEVAAAIAEFLETVPAD